MTASERESQFRRLDALIRQHPQIVLAALTEGLNAFPSNCDGTDGENSRSSWIVNECRLALLQATGGPADEIAKAAAYAAGDCTDPERRKDLQAQARRLVSRSSDRTVRADVFQLTR